MGYGKGSMVGIMSDNMPEWTIADIGILAAQGIVVPLYATSSKEQIKFIVDQTQMKLMFVGNQKQLDNAVWALKNTESLKKVVVFNDNLELVDNLCIEWKTFINQNFSTEYDEELKRSIESIKPDDLATILYTSGTTGEPKGVMLGHDNFTQCFNIHDKRLNVYETDVSFCFLPLSHVFERSWTYYMLYKGAINVFLENTREVIDDIKVVKPTVMCTVPRFFEKTFDGIQNELQKWPSFKRAIFNWSVSVGYSVSEYRCKNKPLPLILKLRRGIANKLVYRKLKNILGGQIKFLPCAGAAINNHHLRFFHAVEIFINYGYGATETTATVSCFKPDIYDLDSCGTIMPEVEVRFSEDEEILVKGKTIFKGYFNNPQATEKALIDGWYKTGDRGYITSEGNLVMTDRINDIFKTSVGKFISPQKIELALSTDPFIDQVIVFGDNRKYVCALIVPSFEKIRAVWDIEGIEDYSNDQLIDHHRIFEFMEKRIEHNLRDFPSYEKVVKFKMLAEPFTIQNEGLTNTLKVRRRLIAERYRDLIEEMYI
jgi:long-chain acyl-CoA synthetase